MLLRARSPFICLFTLTALGLWSCSSDTKSSNDPTGSGGFSGDGDAASGGTFAGSGGLASSGGSVDPGVGGSLGATGGAGNATGGAGNAAGGADDGTGGMGNDGSGGSGTTTPIYSCPAGSNTLTLTLAGLSISTPVEPPAPLNDRANLEGPVWINGSLYASQLSFNGPGRILRYASGGSFEEFIADSDSNGLATDATGRLYAARQGNGSVSSYNIQNPGQAPSILVDQYQSAYFKSPNDLALRSDGTLYFTDPDWQEAGNSQSPRQSVERAYSVSANDQIVTAISPLPNKPNGIILSPDESTLYIGGTGAIFSYNVAADASVTGGTSFGTGGSDGFGMDCAGNLYATAGNSVVVFRPDGSELGRIDFPSSGSVTNVAFGGPNRTTLFVTRMSPPRLYSIELNVPGFPY